MKIELSVADVTSIGSLDRAGRVISGMILAVE